MKKSNHKFKSFYILPNLSLTLRITITLFLIISAIFLQFYFEKYAHGFFILLLASVFNLVRNIKYEVETSGKREWKEVTEEEYKKFLKRMEKIKKIRGLSLSAKFSLLFIPIFLISFFSPFVAKGSFINKNVIIIFTDSLILFLPVFFSGNKFFRMGEEEDTYIKAKNLLYLLNFSELKTKKYDVIPYFEIAKVKNRGEVPCDARVLIKIKDMNKNFIGVQFQVSINNVRNRKYPYFYGIIIAKKDFDLFKKLRNLRNRDNTVFEFSEEEDVDVVVIRQKTTKTSGYYTDKSAIERIIYTSLQLVENIKNSL